MKIRQSHITNSSSSSFCVVFPKIPKTVEEMTKLLFGDDDIICYEYNYDGANLHWPATELADTVLSDMGYDPPKPLTPENLAHEMIQGYGIWNLDYQPPMTPYYCGEREKKLEKEYGLKCPEFPKQDATQEERQAFNTEYNKYYEAKERLEEQKAIEIATEWIEKTKAEHPDVNKFYVFEYSDNDGKFSCQLEHGGTFNNLPHIKVSKH